MPPVALRYLAKVPHRPGQAPQLAPPSRHLRQQPPIFLADQQYIRPLLVVQDMRGPLHPTVGPFNLRPPWGGLRQPSPQQLLQALQLARSAPLFAATRPSESAMALRRP